MIIQKLQLLLTPLFSVKKKKIFYFGIFISQKILFLLQTPGVSPPLPAVGIIRSGFELIYKYSYQESLAYSFEGRTLPTPILAIIMGINWVNQFQGSVILVPETNTTASCLVFTKTKYPAVVRVKKLEKLPNSTTGTINPTFCPQ